MARGSLNFVSALLVAFTVTLFAAAIVLQWPVWLWIATLAAGLYCAASPRIINEWERGVLMRLGRFHRVVESGIVWIVPGVDAFADVVDMRIRSTSFSAEKTLTKDTVPVDVDAVLFWVVTDAQRAILEVEKFRQTVAWAAQTTLRDVIGKSELVRMIAEREALDDELQKIIDAKTSDWGVTVQSVEIRDVRLPAGLEDAMSRKAQADREKEARVILAQSERQVAEQMELASEVYQQNPIAMQLRAMNMTYESIKENGALMVVPSGMVEAANLGVLGMATSAFRLNGQVGRNAESGTPG
jgi:regulator of protease activity HflC (stomatin/prohibitin superfamily)